MATKIHATVEDVLLLSAAGERYELIDGELVPMFPNGFEHGEILGETVAILRNYVRARKLGRVVGGDVLFRLDTRGSLARAPDIAFVRRQRLRGVDLTRPFDGSPDLAVEIVSPRNKDRPDSREMYARRYLGYVRQGVHLMLIDVLPRPVGFSFADVVNAEVGFPQPPTPTPFAFSWRVGEPVPDGTLLAVWRRPLAVGEPLPVLPLALTVHEAVPVDLDHTYREAARRVYLD